MIQYIKDYHSDLTNMSNVYDEIEIEDMVYDKDTEIYTYPCPCGDKFTITLEELLDGEEIATCPSCTLRIRVIFDQEVLPVSVLLQKEIEEQEEQAQVQYKTEQEEEEEEQKGELKDQQ